MEYEVVWKIDVEAESHEEAAKMAKEIQQDPDSLATHLRSFLLCGSRMHSILWTA